MNSKGVIPVKKLLNWIYYTDNFLGVLKMLHKSFADIKVVEYLENNYTLEIKKQKEISMGFIFGVMEDMVSIYINVYFSH